MSNKDSQFSKFYFDQFRGKDGEPVGKKEEIKFKKCSHKNAKLVVDERGTRIQCSCGVGWNGNATQLSRILKDLTS
ncbi:MAG: hypothetical protein KatS3mg101_0948 [Patescibacteria group bacterium]|nr:MAG: hypothetical protein KatS3mg101_0948 [Patescibacteria group bacterium]